MTTTIAKPLGSVARITFAPVWADAPNWMTHVVARIRYCLAQHPDKIFNWAYLIDIALRDGKASVSESTLRRKFEVFENEGLIRRHLVRESHDGTVRTLGFRITLSEACLDYLGRELDLHLRSAGKRDMDTGAKPEPSRSAVPMPETPSAPEPRRAIAPERLNPEDRKLLEAFTQQHPAVARVLTEAMGEGVLEDQALVAAGCPLPQVAKLQLLFGDWRDRYGEAVTTPLAAVMGHRGEAAPVIREGVTQDQAEAACQSRGEALPEVRAATPAAEPLAATASFVVSEAAWYAPALLRSPRLLETLAEIVFSVERGVFADSGPLLKRVRAALKLVRQGRWSTPTFLEPNFQHSFLANVCVA